MSRTTICILGGIIGVLIYSFFAFDIPYRSPESEEHTSSLSSQVSITTVQKGDTISSPVALSGTAPGPWFFEASFPISIIDSTGNIVGQGIAQAQGDWMVTGLVPWKALVEFTSGTSTTGSIRLIKDNPSGDPERDEHVDVPISFI